MLLLLFKSDCEEDWHIKVMPPLLPGAGSWPTQNQTALSFCVVKNANPSKNIVHIPPLF